MFDRKIDAVITKRLQDSIKRLIRFVVRVVRLQFGNRRSKLATSNGITLVGV